MSRNWPKEYEDGRREERASILGWLQAEAAQNMVADDLEWATPLVWASKALENLAPTSEFDGLKVRPIEDLAPIE